MLPDEALRDLWSVAMTNARNQGLVERINLRAFPLRGDANRSLAQRSHLHYGHYVSVHSCGWKLINEAMSRSARGSFEPCHVVDRAHCGIDPLHPRDIGLFSCPTVQAYHVSNTYADRKIVNSSTT